MSEGEGLDGSVIPLVLFDGPGGGQRDSEKGSAADEHDYKTEALIRVRQHLLGKSGIR